MGAKPQIDLSYQSRPTNKDLEHIPGDYGWIPYIGKTIELLDDLYGYVDKNYKQYGEVFKTRIGGLNGVVVVGPENYKQIYIDKDKCFSAQMGYDDSLAHFYRKALLLRDHDDHRIQRRMFQTAFKNDQMRGYTEIMNPLFEQSMQDWDKEKNFLFFPSIKKTLLDIGATVFIGVDEIGPEMEQINQAFLDISEKGLMGLVKIDKPPFKYHKGRRGARFLEQYFRDAIPQRRAGNGKDMLSHMSKETQDNGDYFSDDDLIPQASFLLFAAHDTTTSTLNHVLLYTAQHPEWQEKLREEARSLNKDYLDYDDLDRVELMELVFKESLRLAPSVSIMQRRTTKPCQIGAYDIPADTIVYVPPVYNHYMEEFWTNPTEFDPMRFAEGREEHKSHTFAYMPFGGGAHKCIGMHFANMIVKCFMHQFLLNYEWTLPENYNPKMESFPLPNTADGLPVILKKIR
jgi:cytochrome P450